LSLAFQPTPQPLRQFVQLHTHSSARSTPISESRTPESAKYRRLTSPSTRADVDCVSYEWKQRDMPGEREAPVRNRRRGPGHRRSSKVRRESATETARLPLRLVRCLASDEDPTEKQPGSPLKRQAFSRPIRMSQVAAASASWRSPQICSKLAD